MDDFFYPGSTFDSMFPVFFSIAFIGIFLLVIGIFVFVIIKGISQWSKNNHSPRLTVPATVITKRSNTSHSPSHDDSCINSSSTYYYVTFQFESGDRSEFMISGEEYGMLAEGDTGNLTFQGTRYLSFTRKY